MITFEQTQQDVAEVKRDLKDLKDLTMNLGKRAVNYELETPILINEVSELKHFSKPTLYLYVNQNKIPHYKKNGRLFFFKSEIIAWIKEGKQKTVSDIKTEADEYLSSKSKNKNHAK